MKPDPIIFELLSSRPVRVVLLLVLFLAATLTFSYARAEPSHRLEPFRKTRYGWNGYPEHGQSNQAPECSRCSSFLDLAMRVEAR